MIANKKILAVVPARSGSKGVPGKNIRSLGGRPLLAYAAEAAKRSLYIDTLILSTNDQSIASVGRSYGLTIPFLRPEGFAQDRSPLIAVIKHAYEFFAAQGVKYDAVLSLQPTCPFLTTATIDAVIELWSESGCESVTTVAEVTQGHPFIAKRILAEQCIEDFLPTPAGMTVGSRHEREKAYYLTGGIYLRDRALLEQAEPKGHCLGRNPKAVIVNEMEAVDINSEMDFTFAEFLIQQRDRDLL